MGLVIRPKVAAHFREARRKTARMASRCTRTGTTCSGRRIASRVPARSSKSPVPDVQDPWGNDYKMHCGPTAPTPAIAFGASLGEDAR
jgi:hypothetical protein